jgi:hypothetical protein
MAFVDDDGWCDGSIGQDGALPRPPLAVCAHGWELDANANALKAAGPASSNIDPGSPIPSPLSSQELSRTLFLVSCIVDSALYSLLVQLSPYKPNPSTMKAAIFLLTVAGAALAQDISGQPECAVSCLPPTN